MTEPTNPNPVYESITDPALEIEAKRRLKERYPDLTEGDIENLWGFEAEKILNGNDPTSETYVA